MTRFCLSRNGEQEKLLVCDELERPAKYSRIGGFEPCNRDIAGMALRGRERGMDERERPRRGAHRPGSDRHRALISMITAGLGQKSFQYHSPFAFIVSA
jgi:hypothetical protein